MKPLARVLLSVLTVALVGAVAVLAAFVVGVRTKNPSVLRAARVIQRDVMNRGGLQVGDAAVNLGLVDAAFEHSRMITELEDLLDDLERFEAETQDAIEALRREYAAKAGVIETFKVGLEKDDISIDSPFLLWLPVDSTD